MGAYQWAFLQIWEKIRKINKIENQYDQKTLKCWTLNSKTALYEECVACAPILDSVSKQNGYKSLKVASLRAI